MKKTNNKILFLIGLVLLFIGVAALVCGIVFEFTENKKMFEIMCYIVLVCGPVSVLFFILQLMLFGGPKTVYKNNPEPTFRSTHKQPITVDVKEVQKSNDEIMYDKYVELYNKNLISKEDLDKKREELLGK